MNEILDAINRIADNMDGESSSSASSNIFDVVFTITPNESTSDDPLEESSFPFGVTCDKTVTDIINAVDSGKKINARAFVDFPVNNTILSYVFNSTGYVKAPVDEYPDENVYVFEFWSYPIFKGILILIIRYFQR